MRRSQSTDLGSSPRVWGTLKLGNAEIWVGRFIPTCVGNMPMKTAVQTPKTVHPHVCGEHVIGGSAQKIGGGSSPRVWGTFLRCAKRCARCTVHPHVCGEHSNDQKNENDLYGSSPRVWGTYLPPASVQHLQRFIPTCVGNIPPIACACSSPPVHPHVCGEHQQSASWSST